jgi:hypothetical protein
MVPTGKEVVMEQLVICPRKPIQVAWKGAILLLSDFLKHPRETLRLCWSAPSWRRWLLDRTTRQNVIIQTPYLRWLTEQRLDHQQQQKLIRQHRHSKAKLVYFLALQEPHQEEAILATWQSLVTQYESPWWLCLAGSAVQLEHWLKHPDFLP